MSAATAQVLAAAAPGLANPLLTQTMRLVDITPVARAVSLFAFEPLDRVPLPPATAGAHVDLHLPLGLIRQYSLVLDPDLPGWAEGCRYMVAAKHDAASRGGSRWLHEQAAPGMLVPVGGPRNHFPLVENAAHTVLIAGGIGITPIWSMVRRLEQLGRPFELHYACQAREDVAFAAAVAARPAISLHVDAEAGRRLDVATICRQAPAEAHLYCCGPAPMLATFEAATATRPLDKVHAESFASRHEAATSGGFEIELATSGAVLPVPAGRRIIDVLREAGVDVQTSCEEGVCGSCETRVISGVPDHRCEVLSAGERLASKTMMVCCGGARSRRLVLDL